MFENLLAILLVDGIYFLWNQILMMFETPREYIDSYEVKKMCRRTKSDKQK
jgi:hypothetical protein